LEYQWATIGDCKRKILVWCKEYEIIINKDVIKFHEKEKIRRFYEAGFIFKKRELP
jgi:hypothetical protein